jgi:hypothetical protein
MWQKIFFSKIHIDKYAVLQQVEQFISSLSLQMSKNFPS